MENTESIFLTNRAIVMPERIIDVISRDDIAKMLYITDIGYYGHADKHFRVRDNGSPQHILIYCVDGEGWYIIGGQKIKVVKNNFFIIHADTPHSYGADDKNPWSIYWIHFTGDKSLLFAPFYNQLHKIDEAPEARFSDRIELFEEMYSNLEMGYTIDNLQYTSLCLWHFIGSLKFVEQYRKVKKVIHIDVVQRAISYMKCNIDKNLSLEDIASSVNYSPIYFGQVFKKKSGYTPLNYFNQLKIQKACQLLDFSNLKIKEIADQLGFYDQYHFSKVFYKNINETPSAYKKRVKG